MLSAGGYGINLYGVSTFSGGIANSGTLSAANEGIALEFVPTFTGGITNSGALIAASGIAVGPGVSTFLGAIVNSGTITGTGGTAINIADGPAGMTIDILGGAISGNIIGAGTTSGDTVNFALGGGSFAYAGTIYGMQAVNINSGTLFDGGAITAAGVTVNAGGTLAPGLPNTTGVLSIAGNLAFNGGDYEVQLTPSAHASATVSGLTISNGTVALAPSGPLGTHYSATTFSILTYGGTLTGAFNPAVAYTGVLQLSSTPTISYVTDNVDLSYGNAYADLATPSGANENQRNVITGINNAILAGDTVPAGFQQLGNLSGAGYLNALSQLSGQDATGAETSAFQLMTGFLDLMLDPFVNGRGSAPGGSGGGGGAIGFAPDERETLPPEIAEAYAEVLKAPPPASFAQRWSAWGTAYGGANTAQGNAAVGSNTINASTYGVAGGMDYRVSPYTLLGFAMAGGGTGWGLANGLGTGYSEALQVGTYAISWFGPAYLSGALAFTNNWFTTNRAALGDQLQANFSGQSYGARLEGGYRVPVWSTLGVTPYGALLAQDFSTPNYSETDKSGGGFGLSYAAMNATDLRTELGARFDDPTLFYGKPLILFGRLAWAHDFVSNPALSAAFEGLPGSSFTVYGAPLPHDSAITSAGAQYFLASNWSLIATFTGNFATGYQLYGGTGTLRYTW
jgi:uncharacterized protein with beta-barrel porin domain